MRITKTETGCWNFDGCLGQDGYGKVMLKRQTFIASRLVAHIFIKPLMSDKEVVAHRCDNPKCINPEHLFITTSRGNTLDRDTKSRGAKGEKHPNSKLTSETVVQMRKLHETGLTYRQISELFPAVTAGCVQAVVKRKTWKHVT